MLILSFLVPVLLWLLAIAVYGIFPFGEYTLLTSDMFFQYTYFLEFYQRVLQEGIDIFYSFAYGLGSETLGLIAYYLASPLNFILYFFSKENITEAILTINLIKIGLCGLSFGIFLKAKFNKKSWINIGFSTCYALMAYNMVYQFNIMWLDGVILLPIIVLGIDRLFEKNKPFLFYFSLLVAIISNWYIGWMLCIFSFLYVIYLSAPNFRENIKKISKLILVGILCAGSAMITILPTVYSQLQVESRFDLVKGNIGNINFKILDILSKFITGSFYYGEITSKNVYSEFLNLPNVFCGIFITLLVILYFTNKKIDKKDKIKDGVILSVMFVSCLFNTINIIWHGFSVNAWFPYRYSFIISFVMIFIAYKSYWKLDDIDNKKTLKIFGIIALICFVIEKMEYTYLVDGVIYVTLLILGMYIYVLICCKNKKYFIGLLDFIICFELLINAIIVFSNFLYRSRNEIYATEVAFNMAIESIEENDNGYFRVENNIGQAPFQFGKNVIGVSNSSSTAMKKGFGLLDSLGFYRISNVTLNYNFTTPFNDSILGIKYFIGDGEKTYYEEYDKENKIWINPDALSLGFMVNEKIYNVKDLLNLAGIPRDPFENQNNIAQNMIKNGKEIFNKINISSIERNNLIESEGSLYQESKLEPSSIKFEINVEEEKEIYLEIYGKGANEKKEKLYVNGKDFLGKEKYVEDFGIINLGKFKKGEKVEIEIKYLTTGEFPVKSIYAYYFNEDEYKELISELKNNQLDIYNMTSSKLEGRVNATSDKDILLITFLYNEFMKVKVDGEEVKPVEVLDSLIGIKLSEGEHTIELWYEPTLVKISGLVSLVFIISSCLVISLCFREKGYKKEF